MRNSLFFVAALACAAAVAQPVYRCTDAAGKVTLSDQLCGNDAVDRARVRVQPNVLDHSGERELHRRQENARLRAQGREGAAAAGSGQAHGRSQADLQAERSNSYECRQAQRELEVVASSITARSNAPRLASEQKMRAACGMREPTQVNIYNNNAGHDTLPRRPFPSAGGGFYNPVAGGYLGPRGEFCAEAAGGMNCPSGFVPVQ